MSWTARVSEGIVRTNGRTYAQTNERTNKRTNKRAHAQTSERTNKQCRKQIMITITITTRHRVKSMSGEGDTSSLDQKSEHEVWIESQIRH